MDYAFKPSGRESPCAESLPDVGSAAARHRSPQSLSSPAAKNEDLLIVFACPKKGRMTGLKQ